MSLADIEGRPLRGRVVVFQTNVLSQIFLTSSLYEFTWVRLKSPGFVTSQMLLVSFSLMLVFTNAAQRSQTFAPTQVDQKLCDLFFTTQLFCLLLIKSRNQGETKENSKRFYKPLSSTDRNLQMKFSWFNLFYDQTLAELTTFPSASAVPCV